MKIRQGFVSNSSSSSFIIKKEYLSKLQIDAIVNHRDLHPAAKHDYWDIAIDDEEICGSTHIDNFDMRSYLTDYVLVPEDIIDWGY
jgi:hypothetical protein